MDRAESVRLIHEAEQQPAAWRVYVFEWTSQGWYGTREEAADRDIEFDGKVHPGDVDVRDDVLGGFMVWVKQWNVDSEWKHRGACEPRVKELLRSRKADEIVVAARGSHEERALLNYGRVRLG